MENFICNRCGVYCDTKEDLVKCEKSHLTEKDIRVISTYSYWPRSPLPEKVQLKIGEHTFTAMVIFPAID